MIRNRLAVEQGQRVGKDNTPDPLARGFRHAGGDHPATARAHQDDVVQVFEEQHVLDFRRLAFGIDVGPQRMAALGAAVERRGEDGVSGGAQMRRYSLPDPSALIGSVQQDIGRHVRFLPVFLRRDQHSRPGRATAGASAARRRWLADRAVWIAHGKEYMLAQRPSGRNAMTSQAVNFYSEGTRLSGDLYLPDGLRPGEKRAGIVLCHGYTGVRNLYLPDTARELVAAGYAVLTFDYKGWGDSDGPRSRLSPYGRVLDSQAALTFLGAQSMVDPGRLGIYGTSYGGATVVWTAAVDPRVKAVVSVVGIGHGRRWMRSVRRPDEFVDLLARSEGDRVRRVLTGESEFVDRSE